MGTKRLEMVWNVEKTYRENENFFEKTENFCPKCPNGIIISEGPKHKFYNSEMECYEASIFFQARAENMSFGFDIKMKAKVKILRPWHAYL